MKPNNSSANTETPTEGAEYREVDLDMWDAQFHLVGEYGKTQRRPQQRRTHREAHDDNENLRLEQLVAGLRY